MKTIVDVLYRIVTGKRRVRRFWTPLFAAFFLSLLAGTVGLALAVDDRLGFTPPLGPSWGLAAGLPLLVGGAFLWGWSVLQFVRAGGTPVPTSPPPRLVETGPYAHVRNPMLSGVFLLLIGLALLIGSASLLLLFTPIFVAGSLLEFKWIEEPELERRLGEAYRAYRRRTPLLLPTRRRPKIRP